MQLVVGQLEQMAKQLRGDYIPNVIRNIQKVQDNKVEVISQVMGIIHALLKQLKQGVTASKQSGLSQKQRL